MKIRFRSSAETEAGICNLLMLQGQAQLAQSPMLLGVALCRQLSGRVSAEKKKGRKTFN